MSGGLLVPILVLAVANMLLIAPALLLARAWRSQLLELSHREQAVQTQLSELQQVLSNLRDGVAELASMTGEIGEGLQDGSQQSELSQLQSRVDEGMQSLAGQIKHLDHRISGLRLDSGNAQPGEQAVRKMFEVAAKLSSRGSDIEDLVRLCGLTHGEAELVRLLNSGSLTPESLVGTQIDDDEDGGVFLDEPAPDDDEADFEFGAPPPGVDAAAMEGEEKAELLNSEDEVAITPSKGHKLSAEEQQLKETLGADDSSEDGEPPQERESVRQMFELAARLSRQGTSTEELVKICGLTQGEAELVRLMHSVGPADEH